MHKLLLPLIVSLALPTSIVAGVDPELHKLCLAAIDYIGCVKAQSTNFNKKRIIVDEGAAFLEGNACPANMAYIGGGTCQMV